MCIWYLYKMKLGCTLLGYALQANPVLFFHFYERIGVVELAGRPPPHLVSSSLCTVFDVNLLFRFKSSLFCTSGMSPTSVYFMFEW